MVFLPQVTFLTFLTFFPLPIETQYQIINKSNTAIKMNKQFILIYKKNKKTEFKIQSRIVKEWILALFVHVYYQPRV